MMSGNRQSGMRRWQARGISAAVVAVVLLCGLAASAQAPQPQQTARGTEPGLLESVGNWFKNSFDRMNAGIQDARGTIGGLGDRATGAAKGAADAAKEAADAVARLPGARVIPGHERCAVAPNGAPDCRAAAEAICRGKGFASGSSLDIQSEQKCPARVWLSGRSAESGECQVESFVTRAMCQ